MAEKKTGFLKRIFSFGKLQEAEPVLEERLEEAFGEIKKPEDNGAPSADKVPGDRKSVV